MYKRQLPTAVTPTVVPAVASSATVLAVLSPSLRLGVNSSTSVTAMEISLVAVEVSPLESVDVARTLTVWDCADS